MHLVTGATGLLGSHLAEQLVQKGERVRALVRGSSKVAFLQELGVELCLGDLADEASLRQAMQGVRVVYHAAAKVGDWGTKSEFQRDTIAGTAHVVAACVAVGVERLLHISSTSAYGHPEPSVIPITETRPLGEKFWMWDDYTRAKIAAEKIVWEAQEKHGLGVTVIRPSWLYGPRDRLSIARITKTIRKGRVWIIGDGHNQMNTVYAGNVAEACLLAAGHPQAKGQAYNITKDGPLTQQEYFNLYADSLGCPRPTKHLPYPLAYGGAWVLEGVYRTLQFRRPPLLTRYAVWLLGRHTVYSTEKAQQELGWQPRIGYAQGIAQTVAWYQEQEKAKR
jgi:nucleoside-diphosphate-sugar epimerase